MESGIFFFCLGAAISVVFTGGIILPMHKWIGGRTLLVAFLSTIGLLVLFAATYLYIHSMATKDNHFLDEYNAFLASTYSSELLLGLLSGPIFLLWLRFFQAAGLGGGAGPPISLSIALAALAGLALILPNLDRWFSRATSVELAKVVKLTIDAKQSDVTDSSPIAPTYSAGQSASIDFKGQHVLDGLQWLADMARGDDQNEKEGMIERDQKYQAILSKDKFSSPQREYKDPVRYDLEFIRALKPLARCLHRYAEEYHDYRLFLVDVKPLLVTLTTFSRTKNLAPPAVAELTTIADELRNTIEKKLETVTADEDAIARCKNPISFAKYRVEAGNSLPYKTIALAYLLSAIGSDDTAIVELGEWLSTAEGVPVWFRLRAMQEQAILLAKVLPGGVHHPSYRKFIRELKEEFKNNLPNKNLLNWSSTCMRENMSVYESQIYFTYVTDLNLYIKAHSNTLSVTPDVVNEAELLRQLNLRCFDNIDYVAKEREAWRGEFLTTFALASIAHSFDERFGRSDSPEKKRVRNQAKAVLSEAVILLEPAVKASERDNEDGTKVPKAKQIFARPTWEDTLLSARAGIRNIGFE
jgi:hypothetical protein